MGKRTLGGPHLDWTSSTNTSLGPIYKVNYKCINSFVYPLATFPGAHRALPDVDAMEKVITHPKLARCLSKLLIRSATNQGGLWVAMKRRYFRSAALIKELGKPAVTTAQAKRLDELGLDFQDLLKMNSESKTPEEFQTALKNRGVNSKPLREKIVKRFHQKSCSSEPPTPAPDL